jgi:hypothetical protein
MCGRDRRVGYGVLVGKPEGKRTLGRPRRRCEDNITMHIQEARWGMDWTNLAKDSDRWRIVAKAMNMGWGGGYFLSR